MIIATPWKLVQNSSTTPCLCEALLSTVLLNWDWTLLIADRHMWVISVFYPRDIQATPASIFITPLFRHHIILLHILLINLLILLVVLMWAWVWCIPMGWENVPVALCKEKQLLLLQQLLTVNNPKIGAWPWKPLHSLCLHS